MAGSTEATGARDVGAKGAGPGDAEAAGARDVGAEAMSAEDSGKEVDSADSPVRLESTRVPYGFPSPRLNKGWPGENLRHISSLRICLEISISREPWRCAFSDPSSPKPCRGIS